MLGRKPGHEPSASTERAEGRKSSLHECRAAHCLKLCVDECVRVRKHASGGSTHLEGVFLELLLPVDEQRAVLDLDLVPVHGDDSLDQRL